MLMILSMGFGLIAAIGISQVMGRSNAPKVKAQKMGPVLVAADHLDHNTLLTPENVRVENWPIEIIPENAVTKMEDIKDNVIRTRLSKGLPVMQPDMLNKNKVSVLSIPEGYKVVAIKVSEDDTIAGLLNPGDKVDVIGLFKPRKKSGRNETFSKTFLKALRVFSVGSQMTASKGSRSETSSRGNAIVGVLVTERQSEAIVYVQKTGSLKLVLRGDYVEGDEDGDIDLTEYGFGDTPQVDDESKEEGGQVEQQVISYQSVQSSPDKIEMVVWEGNDARKVTFQDGALPQTTGSTQQASRQPRDEDSRENLTGQEDPDSFEESDRGLEEDQYRGE
jgi:pilus assembly protein CpaB